MRRYIRANTPGATYFFTAALQDRSARWLVDHVSSLRACVARVKTAHPFHIDAMVVLPDHLHALWTLPEEDADFSLRWRLIKRSFTHCLMQQGVLEVGARSRRGEDERGVWQRRFWEHQIRDDLDYERHVDYIHFNPVKHGWVMRARDWPHSSLHRFVREGRLGADWGLSAAIEGQFGE
ncbi:transposase [Ramlibacter sp.]|uniref:REP-associated tyrosine transposase n=1 Tax=Ramlibacter sp. TaxID=1917967 RepID=UPI00261EADBB|nr:transposase [Ramlibacter sp.]MDB5953860.1 transposase IS200-family protein [Ramlibacter sp.]